MTPPVPSQSTGHSEPQPFDGYEYRVVFRGRDDVERVYEGCHAMPTFSGHGVILVVPAVNGEGGGIAGDTRDPRVVSVERTGIHKQSWVDAKKRDAA